MIGFLTNQGEVGLLKIEGDTTEVMADMCVLIGSIYSQIHRHDPVEAEAFKRCFVRMLAEDDGVVFDKNYFDDCFDKDCIIRDEIVKFGGGFDAENEDT